MLACTCNLWSSQLTLFRFLALCIICISIFLPAYFQYFIFALIPTLYCNFCTTIHINWEYLKGFQCCFPAVTIHRYQLHFIFLCSLRQQVENIIKRTDLKRIAQMFLVIFICLLVLLFSVLCSSLDKSSLAVMLQPCYIYVLIKF